MRKMVRMVTTWLGSAMVAPARSSFNSTSTGLNQYRFCGVEQKVMPLFLDVFSWYPAKKACER